MPCHPGGCGQVGVGLVEAYEHRIISRSGSAADLFRPIKAETDGGERAGDDIAIAGLVEPDGDVCFMPFEAYGPERGSEVDVQLRITRRQGRPSR